MVGIVTGKDSLLITRKRWGRGFFYLDSQGEKIRDKAVLRRIKALTIPPMWEEVKICATGLGKIQAVGRDNRGRKQYIYHERWQARRQHEKFARLRHFGEQLPVLRAHALEMLQRPGWPREKVLALMVLTLDETGIRIGNRQYLDANETYGLSTLRRRHLDQEGEAITFHFKGKSHQERVVTIEDALLVRFIRRVAEQPGYEIFRYREGGRWHTVDSDEINAYIHEKMGAAFSSKYFRTWVANRLLVEQHAEAMKQKAAHPRRSRKRLMVGLVARQLGNTLAVCENHYLHPVVLKEAIAAKTLPLSTEAQPLQAGHTDSEKLLLRWMQHPQKSC